MITCLLVSAFFGFVVFYTGPACDQHRKKRKAKKYFPFAKAKYLPPAPPNCSLCGRAHYSHLTKR